MSIAPTPRDGAPVVVVAVEAVPIVWIGTTPGVPGEGSLAGDGSETSRRIIAQARALWAEPIEVDHPSWIGPALTVGTDPVGAMATLLHIADGRGKILQAPVQAYEDLIAEPADFSDLPEETPDVP